MNNYSGSNFVKLLKYLLKIKKMSQLKLNLKKNLLSLFPEINADIESFKKGIRKYSNK